MSRIDPELLSVGLGLTSSQAAIIARLWRAQSAWISSQDISESTASASRMYDHAAKLRGPETVKVHVCHIRKKLGDDFVLGHSHYGFTLGALGILTCKRLIAENAKCHE